MRHRFQSLAFVLAIWAVFAAVLVPPGFMVDAGKGTITICSLEGAKQIPDHNKSSPKMQVVCPFAFANTHVVLPTFDSAAVIVSFESAAIDTTQAREAAFSRPWLARIAPRGPPVLLS